MNEKEFDSYLGEAELAKKGEFEKDSLAEALVLEFQNSCTACRPKGQRYRIKLLAVRRKSAVVGAAKVPDVLGFDPKKGETHLTRFEEKGDLLTVSQPTPLAPNIRPPGGMILTKFTFSRR